MKSALLPALPAFNRPLSTRQRLCAIGLLWGLLALSPLRQLLESSMRLHMLLQLPLLAALGAVAALQLDEAAQRRLSGWLGGTPACLLLALFTSTYWMLPRALDAALGDTAAEIAKFISLPLGLGLPLALVWQRIGAVGRGFILTKLISMLAFGGWLYIAAPLRLCNNYLLDEQTSAGWLMLQLAALLFITWLTRLLFAQPATESASGPSASARQSLAGQRSLW